MSVRLRDEAILLEPGTSVDPYTEEPVADWNLEPLSATPTPFAGFPVSSTEQVLTSDTVVARWEAYLPAEFDGIVTPLWRIRWDGDDYDIDGDVERWKAGEAVRYLAVTLKRVS